MSGSVQWTEITSLVDYTICCPQIKLVLDGPCWSVAAENLKKNPQNTNGRLAIPAPAGLLVIIQTELNQLHEIIRLYALSLHKVLKI